jgi:hypothetical protein
MTASRFRSRAFGLEIDASFEAPGLPPFAGDPVGPVTRADLVEPEAVDAPWRDVRHDRILEERFGGEAAQPDRTIDAHPELGYRLYARGFGLARIAPDGSAVECAPPSDEPWSWQRFLVGRVLPWASVLRGYEVLHASAVAIDGAAVLVVGMSGAGKTSLALRLVAAGAVFVTDDVAALDVVDGAPRVHPGASIAAVRPDERGAIEASVWSRLGTVLGESGKTYIALPRAGGPLPVAAICFIGAGDGPLIERMDSIDPRLLFTSTFVLGVQTPARLRNQLEVCAAIATRVPALWLRPRVDAGSARLAEAVLDELRGARATA